MRKFLAVIALAIVSGCSTPEGPATRLEKANVLPLELNDRFQFRKIKTFYLDPLQAQVATRSEPIIFERQRIEWGAIQAYERQARYGNYYWFYWRARDEADITVRFEYRQVALGDYVMAQERYYPGARGSFRSEFTVTGDDFLEFGRVNSWRAALIVDGRIVAITQSFLWK